MSAGQSIFSHLALFHASILRLSLRRSALGLFCLYIVAFPGSTLTVALDRVPAWGAWIGAALLFVQGAAVLCWLAATYGRRGVLAAALVFLLAWGVEHVGVATGFPFGAYRYTAVLRPQLPGVVPLAIPLAWLMVTVGAAECGRLIFDTRSHSEGQRESGGMRFKHLAQTATLVLLLDVQLETVATAINGYWVWLDHGPYYDVPTANFVAWWLIGLAMAALVAAVLRGEPGPNQVGNPLGSTVRSLQSTFQRLPAALYILNTLMFSAINLARGYALAGLVGLVVLLVAAARLRTMRRHAPRWRVPRAANTQTGLARARSAGEAGAATRRRRDRVNRRA